MAFYYQTQIALSTGLLAFISAVSMAFTSPALLSMRDDPDFEITKEDGSWILSVVTASAVVGSLVAWILLDTFGRRFMIILVSFPLSLAWAIIATSSTVKGVIFGRMLTGVCIGFQTVAGPVLIAETIQVNMRGKVAIFGAIFRNLGISLGYIAGIYLSWRSLSWMGCLLSLPSALVLLHVPESPYFLTCSGKRESSLHSLKLFREDSATAGKEQKILDENCKKVRLKKASPKDLLHPTNRWSVFIGAWLMAAQQMTGLSSFVFFIPIIFEVSGDTVDPDTASSIVSIQDFLGVFISLYCAAKYERRTMLRRSTTYVTMSLLVLFAFFWVREAGGIFATVAKEFTFIPILTLIAFKSSLFLGWAPVPLIYLREGLPSSVRGLAASLIVTISWVSSFVITKTFHWSNSLFGIHYTFLSYAVLTYFNGFFIHKFMPESYRKSTAEMDQLFRNTYKEKEQ